MAHRQIVCLDSHVIIWGIKEQSEPGQEAMVRRAKAFLEQAAAQDIICAVPSVVVAELLMRIPGEMHALVCNLLEKGFEVPPFDLPAARKFAEIWRSKQEAGELERLLSDPTASRETLKVDCMIVAIASSQGMDHIYSHDEKLRRFADGYIPCSEIPIVGKQMGLFPSTGPNQTQ